MKIHPVIYRFALIISALLCVISLSACGGRLAQAQGQTPEVTPTQPASTQSPTIEAIPTSAPLTFVTGRNDYEIPLDAVTRKFIIYVPTGYDPSRPTPVVFMFHGSNQGGQLMFEKSLWAAQADQENFIVVFPTSWKYRTLEENKVEDKWNTAGLYNEVVPGTQLQDDVKFVRVMLGLLKVIFSVDDSRLYATGFSNGGGFVLTRLMVEMNDVFAAYATSGSALGSEGKLENPPTGVNASLYSILGSNDEKISTGTGHALPFPMLAEDIAADPTFSQMIAMTTTVLSLDPSYSVEYDRPSFTTMTFDKSLTGAHNQYIFRMISGMGHVYPSGDNNRAGLDAAEVFWEFFRGYSK